MSESEILQSNQYTTNPTATFWLSHTSPYFKDVPLVDDADTEELILRIKSACEFVETYCRRKFAKRQYTGVFTVRQDGSLILDNPPVESVDRLCYCNGGWLNVANTTAYSPRASTTNDRLKLTQIVAGVQATTTFTYADNATLQNMADAINGYGNGWVANVTAGTTQDGYPLAQLPSTDIVGYQLNECHTQTTLLSWLDYNSLLAPNIWPTRGYYLQYDVSSGILDWFFPRGLRLRCDYTAGFDPVPEAIKEVTSRLVLGTSRKKTETLGNYSYTLEDIEALPNNDKRILGYYRERTV